MTTASVTASPRYSSAVCFILPRIMAEISAAEYFLPSTSTMASPPGPSTMVNGLISTDFFTSASVNLRPMRRLMANRVLVGLVTA